MQLPLVKLGQVLILLLLLSGGVYAQKWSAASYAGDIWMNYVANNQILVQYRLGAGGCIAEARDNAGEILGPSYTLPNGQVNDTDRVIQAVAWAVDKNGNAYWNVNQAGSYADAYSIVYDVVYYQSEGHIDVYSICNQPFQPTSGSGCYALFTQYWMEPNAELRIRRVVITPSIFNSGTFVPQYTFVWQAWTPLSADRFNAFAFGPGQDGYIYTLERLGAHMGIIYSSTAPVLFETGAPITNGPSAEIVDGVNAMYPFSLAIENCQVNEVIDSWCSIEWQGTESDYSSVSKALPGTVVYQQSSDAALDLPGIIRTLCTLNNLHGVQANHLGPYMQVRP